MNIFLRYGSHAEKDYFHKLLRFFDGVVFNANLLETTPSAVASLTIKYKNTGYLVDPMTYSFGEYTDHSSSKLISDLDWLKSKTKKGFQIKSSYRKLSIQLGGGFQNAVEKGKAITLENLENDQRRGDICRSVIEYQKNRIKNILLEDDETKPFADNISSPNIIFSPYFFIDKARKDRWINVYKNICEDSSPHSSNLYLTLCFDYELLLDSAFIDKILDLGRGFKGICLWINNFDESVRGVEYLKSFRKLVEGYKKKNLKVFNRHGGYFSYLLSKFGMTSVSHGIGYGFRKNIMPVLGGGTPTINYYFPDLHGKFGAVKIIRMFDSLGVKNHDDFFKKICNCAICKGVIKDNLNNFSKGFGETRPSEKKNQKEVQTPAAAKRARFHFLLSMLKEKKNVDMKELEQLISQLKSAKDIAEFPVLDAKYIDNWIEALKD